MKPRCKFFITGVAALALALPSFSSTPATSSSCPEVQFVFARGSGTELGGAEYQAFQAAINSTIPAELPDLSYQFYELGSASQGNYQYPAVSVSSFNVALEAYVSAGRAGRFNTSVRRGVGELTTYIRNMGSTCAGTRFVLAGYSQGAMVISKALPQIDASKIIYVATMGDPKLYLPEGYGKEPLACQSGATLSEYRVNVPDCHTDHGILGALKPYQQAAYQGKLGAWCNAGDFMCGSYFDFSSQDSLLRAHLSYSTDGSYMEASQIIAAAIKEQRTKNVLPLTPSSHDVVILFDTTNSMPFFLPLYQAAAIQTATQVIQQGGRIALYEYRDLADPFPTRQLCDLSCSLDEFRSHIVNLALGGGGFDAGESALSASLTAMNQLEWQYGANKSIIIFTDDTFKNPDEDGTTLEQVVERSLQIDPVSFYVVNESGWYKRYQSWVDLTGGRIFNTRRVDYAAVTARPVAVLSQESYVTMVGETLEFDASASTAQNTIDHYEWDLDGDGVYELVTTTPLVQQTYTAPLDTYIRMKVVDAAGYFSMMSARLQVVEPGTTAAVQNLSALQSDDSVVLEYQLIDAPLALILVDDYPLGFTAQNAITLTDLPEDVTLTVIPISAAGQKGISASVSLTSGRGDAGQPSQADQASAQSTTQPSGLPITLKVPNAGAR